MGIMKGIFGDGFEQGVMEKSSRIILNARNANIGLRNVINGSGDVSAIKKIEEASDRAVFEVSNSITTGGISPNLIPDMLRFVDFEDNIVDSIFNLSRAYVRYRVKSRKVNDYIKKQLLAANSISANAIEVLLEMHKADNIADARKLRFKIEKYEQQGDAIKDAMLDYAYNSKIDFKAFNHVLDLAYLADDVQDNCEDVSDILVSILASILS